MLTQQPYETLIAITKSSSCILGLTNERAGGEGRLERGAGVAGEGGGAAKHQAKPSAPGSEASLSPGPADRLAAK